MSYKCPGCGSRDGKDDGQGGCLYCNQPMPVVWRDMPPAIDNNMNQRDIAQGTRRVQARAEIMRRIKGNACSDCGGTGKCSPDCTGDGRCLCGGAGCPECGV